MKKTITLIFVFAITKLYSYVIMSDAPARKQGDMLLGLSTGAIQNQLNLLEYNVSVDTKNLSTELTGLSTHTYKLQDELTGLSTHTYKLQNELTGLSTHTYNIDYLLNNLSNDVNYINNNYYSKYGGNINGNIEVSTGTLKVNIIECNTGYFYSVVVTTIEYQVAKSTWLMVDNISGLYYSTITFIESVNMNNNRILNSPDLYEIGVATSYIENNKLDKSSATATYVQLNGENYRVNFSTIYTSRIVLSTIPTNADYQTGYNYPIWLKGMTTGYILGVGDDPDYLDAVWFNAYYQGENEFNFVSKDNLFLSAKKICYRKEASGVDNIAIYTDLSNPSFGEAIFYIPTKFSRTVYFDPNGNNESGYVYIGSNTYIQFYDGSIISSNPYRNIGSGVSSSANITFQLDCGNMDLWLASTTACGTGVYVFVSSTLTIFQVDGFVSYTSTSPVYFNLAVATNCTANTWTYLYASDIEVSSVTGRSETNMTEVTVNPNQFIYLHTRKNPGTTERGGGVRIWARRQD